MNFQLFSTLAAYGDQIPFNIYIDPNEVMYKLREFENDWTQYNPRKLPNNRHALSITNLTGELGPGPDLYSLLKYNMENNTRIQETDFTVPTPVYDIFAECFEPFKQWLIRCHVLQLRAGGYFPRHIDNYGTNINSFRLLLPLKNCNPMDGYFLIEDKILYWKYGKLYFMNTCKQHVVFNATDKYMTFVVLNVLLTEECIEYFLSPRNMV